MPKKCIIIVGGDEMITLSKIAKLAHVSVSTVSKAFSMSAEVSEEIRDAVFDIAKQYGVFKKYYRAKYPKHIIAVICPEFEGRDYSTALTALQKYLSAHNCEICVASTNFSSETEKELLDYYNSYATVDGIICIASSGAVSYSGEIPVAHICHSLSDAEISVNASYDDGYKQAIAHLKESGVQTIGLLIEPHTVSTLETLTNLCLETGYTEKDLFKSTSHARFNKGGYEAMEQLFKKNQIPEAIICAYDNIAIGAMRCILDHGLKIPEDILVIGRNNNLETAYLNPPLASVDSHLELACEKAASALLAHLNGKPYDRHMTVKSEFIPRESAIKK